MIYAIETNGLVKSFGDTRALNGVDLRIRKGTVFGLLGPNGAGKTTTIRILATLLRPDAGSATVLGHDVVREAATVRQKVSLTGQYASVDEDLTGHENLVLMGRLLGLSWRAARSRGLGAARGLRPRGGRGPPGADLLRRHAPAHRHRRQPRGDSRDPLPRRADHRPRSPEQEPGLGSGAPHRR